MEILLNTPEEQQDHREIRRHLRAQSRTNGRAGAGYQTTVQAISSATGMSIELVLAHLKDAWLVVVNEDTTKPPALWTVEEDGE